MDTEETEDQCINTCPGCLSKDKILKVLPNCDDSFCEGCIKTLAGRHPGGTFPCPACKKQTSLPSGRVAFLKTERYTLVDPPQRKPAVKDTLPSGGVGSLDSSYYTPLEPPIQEKPVKRNKSTYLPSGHVASSHTDLYTHHEPPQRKPRKKGMCNIHNQIMKYYCMRCDEAICVICLSSMHENHLTDDLTSTVALKARQRCLQSAASDVEKTVTSLREEKEALGEKRGAVEKEIHRRYEVEVAAAAAKRDKELASLQSMHNDLQQNVDSAIHEKEGHKRELSILLQEINDVIASGAPSNVITLYAYKVDVVTSQEETPLQRPVLQSDVTADVMVQTVCDYMGSVQISTVSEDRRPEVTVTQKFTCGQDPDTEIFAMTYEDSDQPRITVSFDRHHMHTDAPQKAFSLSGQCVLTSSEYFGKVSKKRIAEGMGMCTRPQPGKFRTYCKSPAQHFMLNNALSGTAAVNRITAICKNPFKAETKAEFTIDVGPHRAFDVDVTGQHYVVLEEPKGSSGRRSVLLYGRSEKKAISSYNPPVDHFAPSDVCFYSLGGRQVLLVTDEGRDEIHVVSIRGRDMKFERFLCPGCPSLIQPTALNVDIAGRLWVACRGGAVLMMEPRD